jgi:hypothetical protein
MPNEYLRKVAIEHAGVIARRVANLVKEELPDMNKREYIGVAAAALASAAAMLDGTEDDASNVKHGGVAAVLAHCCRCWDS